MSSSRPWRGSLGTVANQSESAVSDSLQRARCRSPIPEVADGHQRAGRDRTLAPSSQRGPERGSAPGFAESLRRAAAPSTEAESAPQPSAVTRGSHHHERRD
jgi:hypothetical protein